jgi:hypothetical protein
LALIFIDFGDSSVILLDIISLEFLILSYESIFVQTDIFYFGWIIYLLEKWKWYNFDLFAMPEPLEDENNRNKPSWPEFSDLPDTKKI